MVFSSVRYSSSLTSSISLSKRGISSARACYPRICPTEILVSACSSAASLTGFWESASVHLIHRARIWYGISRCWSCCSRGFSISSSLWLLSMGTLGACSLINSVSAPATNIQVFSNANAMANISNSMTAYCVSVSVKHLDPAWTVFQLPSACCCCKTNPRPTQLASVMILVGLFGSKNVTYQRDARIRLTVFNVRANLSTEKQNICEDTFVINTFKRCPVPRFSWTCRRQHWQVLRSLYRQPMVVAGMAGKAGSPRPVRDSSREENDNGS